MLLPLAAACALVALPTSLDFGWIDAGDTDVELAYLKNTSDQPIVLEDLQIQDDSYSIVGSNCPAVGATMAAGQECTLRVIYHPIARGWNPTHLIATARPASGPRCHALIDLAGGAMGHGE